MPLPVQRVFLASLAFGCLFFFYNKKSSNDIDFPKQTTDIRQNITAPTQPTTGPGGSEYTHATVTQYDFAEYTDGFWLYEPADPKPKSAPVVVFVHGYGAYNPMIYGEWITHLVRKGNIVVFPRYQRNLSLPRPDKFAPNVAVAIKDAFSILKKDDHVNPSDSSISLMAHSYGGVVSAELAMKYDHYQIPKPDFVLACSPGTGPFSGGRFDSYQDIPADVKLVVTISENDRTVGDEFGWLLYNTATQVKDRTLVRQFTDYHGTPAITAHHNEPYGLNKAFDSGLENFSTKRALNLGRVNAIDYYGYWKFGDALMDCCRNGTNCEFAIGNTEQQSFLGKWSDGTPVKPWEVFVPED